MDSARRARVPAIIPAAIFAAWAIAAYAQRSGSAAFLHHHALIERGPPLPLALALFVLAWLVMIAAMMLPSTYGLLRIFSIAAAGQPRPGAVVVAMVSGYTLVWSLFGIAAFGFDVALHRSLDRLPWLNARPWLVAGSVLALAGLFQFTPWKDRCLRACRLPANFLLHHYRRGARAAFEIGYRHGLFCVGCCWALMLVAFGAGFASLWWMAALTALMVYEKLAAHGRRAVPLAGTVLVIWSVLVFGHPAWLPHALSGL